MSRKSDHLQIRVTAAQKATLKRLATGAGQDVSSYVLSRALPSAQREFLALIAALDNEEEAPFVLAELSDLLSAIGRAELVEAVEHADLDALSPFVSNYVAAMVEQACHLKDVPPPAWTRTVAPLESPYFAAPLVSLRLYLLLASPVPYRRRNLFIDASVGARV